MNGSNEQASKDHAGVNSPPITSAMSEIAEIAGHFLSDHRERVQAGASDRARPVRTPPRAQVQEPMPAPAPVAEVALAPVGTWLVMLAEGEEHRAAAFTGAIAVAVSGGRAGVVRAGDGMLHLGLVDSGLPVDAGLQENCELGSLTELRQAVAELSTDLDRWVIGLNVDDAGAVEVLRGIARTTCSASWVVIVEQGDDGMVAAYRVIKTLAGVTTEGKRPRLVLACVGSEAVGWANRLRAVMRKFLQWDAADAILLPVEAGDEDPAHPVMRLRERAGASEWQGMIVEMLSPGSAVGNVSEPIMEPVSAQPVVEPVAPAVIGQPSATAEPAREDVQPPPRLTLTETGDDDASEVIELTGTGEGAMLDSIVRSLGDLSLCDLENPRLPSARVAVTSEGRLVLLSLAANTQDLAAVGQGLAWLRENATLIARACKPMEIIAALLPEARLFATPDSAEGLARLVVGTAVKVQAYRTVKWAGRRGLLLEAA